RLRCLESDIRLKPLCLGQQRGDTVGHDRSCCETAPTTTCRRPDHRRGLAPGQAPPHAGLAPLRQVPPRPPRRRAVRPPVPTVTRPPRLLPAPPDAASAQVTAPWDGPCVSVPRPRLTPRPDTPTTATTRRPHGRPAPPRADHRRR